MSALLKEEGYIRLIQCFLNPDLMLNRPESPNPLTGDQQVLELIPGGGARPIQTRGQAKEDPLRNLFVCSEDEKQGMCMLLYYVCGSQTACMHSCGITCMEYASS